MTQPLHTRAANAKTATTQELEKMLPELDELEKYCQTETNILLAIENALRWDANEEVRAEVRKRREGAEASLLSWRKHTDEVKTELTTRQGDELEHLCNANNLLKHAEEAYRLAGNASMAQQTAALRQEGTWHYNQLTRTEEEATAAAAEARDDDDSPDW